MNLSRRIRFSLMALGILRVRRELLMLKLHVLGKLVNLTVNSAQARNKRKLETFSQACASCTERTNALTLELRNLDRFPEDRKRQLLRAKSALLQENENLRRIASHWVYARPTGATLLEYVLTVEQCKAINTHLKCEALTRIVSRIKCDTFYLDLLIWLVVPGGRCEELLGDLNEEYLLRISNDGETRARAWYRHQATATISDFLWMKIERLSAVGTLVDLVDRWFKH